MKSCPTCNRTYPDDTLAFCLMDGSVLSAPYDPEKKKIGTQAGELNAPRTEVLRTPAPETLPPTQAAGEPRDSLPTITSPTPIVPPLDRAIPRIPTADPDQSESQSDAWLWVGVVVVAVIVIVLLMKFA